MIRHEELGEVLRFVGGHWNKMSGDPEHRAMRALPDDFWMNSLGGRAGKGYWVTTLMYTEDPRFAETFKEVLAKWQAKGMEKPGSPDLIQIGRK